MNTSKRLNTTLVLLLLTNSLLYSQFTKTMYTYKGNANISSFDFFYDVTLNFSTPITGEYRWSKTAQTKGFYCTDIKNDEIIINKLYNVSRVISNTNYITYTIESVPVEDYYQNNIYLNVNSGYNKNSIKFSIEYPNMATSVDFLNAVYSPYVLLTFPVVRSSLSSTVLKYLNASSLVESTNSNISSMATSITSGCTDLRTAIIKLSQWIESNIKMENTNPSNKSTVVFSTKIADCDGAAHLLAAFCRSLNIPARIVSGYVMNNPFNYPLNKSGTSTFSWGSSSDWHAVCEIYIPHMNKWVRCDPAQRSVLFGNQNFLKMATGLESTNQLSYGCSISYSYNQPINPALTTINLSPAAYTYSKNSNFQFVKSETFSGTNFTSSNFGVFCAVDPTTITGFYDKLTIQNPLPGTVGGGGQLPDNTYLMMPCSSANFYAKFASESTPTTYSQSFDWSLVLYRANGEEYTYAQQNDLLSNAYNPNDYGEGCYWQPTLGILPPYDWLYDPSGNIYGKIKVTVHISDGDTKYDETTIGMRSINSIQNINYSANTTINSCAELKLTNISISGTPSITFNANGLGATIIGSFEMPLGATLTINP